MPNGAPGAMMLWAFERYQTMGNVSLSVRVRIDIKAALVAGKMLSEQETITVSQDVMGEQWESFVEDLRQENGVWHWGKISLTDTDQMQIRAWYTQRLDEQVAAVENYEQLVKDRDASLADPMVDKECFWAPDRMQKWDFGQAFPAYRNFTGKVRSLPCGYYYGPSNLPRLLQDRVDAARLRIDQQTEQNRLEFTQANDQILASILPAMEAAKAEYEAAEAKKQAEADASRKAAELARFAERLETGYWTKETPSYNERRYGPYWCASVSFENGPKPIYSWGESTGKWGQAGILRVPCKPGDVIAWGQKDTRRPDKSDHFLMLMREDGGMTELTKAEAWQHWQEQHAVKA